MAISREFYRNLTLLRESAMRESAHDPSIGRRLAGDIVVMVKEESSEMATLSLRKLFEATVEDGFARLEAMDPRHREMTTYFESADAVSTRLFAHTMGQIFYNAVLEAYRIPELIGDQLVTVIPSNVLGSEKIAGVSAIGDQVEVVTEGDPYPSALVGECFVVTPEKIKRGLTVPVTKETLHADKTAQVMQRASNVGQSIAINREKRILDVVTGISTVYQRNNGAVEATYQSANTVTSNALVDWTDVDAADTKLLAQKDPDTDEPIVVTASTVVCAPAVRNTASRIQRATSTIKTVSGVETRVDGNSLNQRFEVASNQYVKERTASDTTWYYGDAKGAFVYMEVWPITVEENTDNSEASFRRDLVYEAKASEMGACGVRERRKMTKNTA